MICSELEFVLTKMKIKAASAEKLRSRRDELVEILEKKNIQIPDQIKKNIKVNSMLDIEKVKDEVQSLATDNNAIESQINLFKKMANERDMLNEQTNKMKIDLENIRKFINNNPNDFSILEQYLKVLTQRIFNLDMEKYELQDEVIKKDCKLDILSCKLSHLILQLKEPLIDLKYKKENNLPLTDVELLSLKIFQTSCANNKLQKHINELTKINGEFTKEYLHLRQNALKQLTKYAKVIKPPITAKDKDINLEFIDEEAEKLTSRPPSVISSYTLDVRKNLQAINPLEVAFLGLKASEMNKIFKNLEELRRQACLDNYEAKGLETLRLEKYSSFDLKPIRGIPL